MAKQTERQKEYSKYLKSDEWKARKEAVLKRCGHKCIFCKTDKNLHVHHTTYERLGHENPEDLFALCKGCHLKVHKGKAKIWVFTQEQYEAFQKIKHIVWDGTYDCITFVLGEG